jgi:hypothetical protein
MFFFWFCFFAFFLHNKQCSIFDHKTTTTTITTTTTTHRRRKRNSLWLIGLKEEKQKKTILTKHNFHRERDGERKRANADPSFCKKLETNARIKGIIS